MGGSKGYHEATHNPRLRKKACDKCHKMKQICDGGIPCSRCKRLKAECTFQRVLKKPGRPSKKVPVNNELAKRVECSSQEVSDSRLAETRESPIPSTAFTKVFLDKSKELINLQNPFSNIGERFLDMLLTFSEEPRQYEVDNETLSESSEKNEILQAEQVFNDAINGFPLDYWRLPEKEMQLLQYFVFEVSPILFIDKTSNSFLQMVIPLAIKGQRIRNILIAIAAIRRYEEDAQLPEKPSSLYVSKGYSVTTRSEFLRDMLTYKSEAELTLVLEETDYFDDSVLLSLLLLAMLSVLEGTSFMWASAMKRASIVISKRGGVKKLFKDRPLLVHLFSYLDLVSSLSTCIQPYVETIPSDGFKREDTLENYAKFDEKEIAKVLNSSFGFRFSIGGEIFKLLGNISTLASLRHIRDQNVAYGKEFDTIADVIENHLQSWQPSEESWENFSLTGPAIELQKNSYVLALQWAAFLRLHQVRYGYNREDRKAQICLRTILQSIDNIDKGADLETGLIFPIIMAGSVAFEQDDREYIMERVRRIKKKLKFGYVNEVEKMLLTIWSRDDKEGHNVNWAAIRYYEYPGLVMF